MITFDPKCFIDRLFQLDDNPHPYKLTVPSYGEFGAEALVRHGFLRPYALVLRACKKEALEIPLDFFLLRFFVSRQKNEVGFGAKPHEPPRGGGSGFGCRVLGFGT